MGVKVACPTRQTIVINGDGSFQMSMNELAAVKAAGMDIKIVLFRNHVLGLVHQIQNTDAYQGPFGVNLEGSPDFSTIAAAYGIPTLTLSSEEDTPAVLDKFLAQEGSMLLMVDIDPFARTGD